MSKEVRSIPKRVGRHARSNIAGYVAIALALSVTPAIANHLDVKSSDIANEAVTTKKIKDNAVKASKLANLPKRRVVGAAKQPKFMNGGQGDCIWQDGSTLLAGLGKVNFYMDLSGIVHLGGVAVPADGAGGDGDCSTVEIEDGIAFRLPKSYRPTYTELQGVAGTLTIIVGKKALEVSPGEKLPAGAVYTDSTLALDGLTFRADSAGGSGVTSASSPSSADPAAKKALRELLGL